MCGYGIQKKRQSIIEAKALDMVGYLTGPGYHPAKIRNMDYWYCSPPKNEKIPSFKINRRLNCWYDDELGKGSIIIDFGIQFLGCSVGEYPQKLNGDFSFHQPVFQQSERRKKESKITILQASKLSSIPLLRYLEQRRIPVEIARQFNCQIRYELDNIIYNGIGFKNRAGGYEIRHLLLINKIKEDEQVEFYGNKVLIKGWSRDLMLNAIKIEGATTNLMGRC